MSTDGSAAAAPSGLKSTRSGAGTTERNDTIEMLRIAAACCIIWFHLEEAPFRRFSYAGLVFFLVVGVILQERSAARTRAPEYLRKRAARLLVPWAAWFAIYGLLNLAAGKSFFPHVTGFPGNVIAGPWIGLWYLPFSLAGAILVYCVVRLAADFRPHLQFAAALSVSIASLVVVSRIRLFSPPEDPWAQLLQAAPSIAIGLAYTPALARLPRSPGLLLVLQGTLLATCGYLCWEDPGMGISYGLGSLAVSAGFFFERRWTWPVATVSSLCFGVYLVHGAVIGGLRMVAGTSSHYVLTYVLIVLISFGGAAVLRRLPYGEKIV